MFPTGTLVWAKQRTFPSWPAIVAPNASGITEKTRAKKKQIHVIFLEYDKQHAWVPANNVAEFTGAEDDKRNGKRVKTAVDTAISMMQIDMDDRLSVLNTGRPVIRGEGATNMQREVGRNDGEDVSDHENDEAVAVNNNGRKKARAEKNVTPSMPKGATNMQHEVGRNDGEDVFDRENDEAVAVNNNGRKRARAEKIVTPSMPKGAINMQHEVERNDEDDVSDHKNTEDVAINNNGRRKAREERSVNMLGGTTNTSMQSEVGRNPGENASNNENTEAVAMNTNGGKKARMEKGVHIPGGTTNTNNRRKSPPHAQTSDSGTQTFISEQTGQNRPSSKKVKITFEMEEETWLKTIEIAPNFMEMTSKFNNADS